MNRGPIPGAAGKLDPMVKARAAWGETMPKEVAVLAEACKAGTARSVAQRIGYSDAVVSHLLNRRYSGDVARVFTAIRGALMGETVMCPILGEIATDRCLAEQTTPFAATNSTRARLFHACKTCPHRQQKDVA